MIGWREAIATFATLLCSMERTVFGSIIAISIAAAMMEGAVALHALRLD